jgi:hypothetical protein
LENAKRFLKPKYKIMKIMQKYGLLLIIIILTTRNDVFGQQTELTHKDVFPKGINIDYGLGNFSVKDYFFSTEKYSGTMPYFNVGWSRFNNKRAFQLNFIYRSSDEIKSDTFSASILNFSLQSNYLYPIGSFSILSKKVYSYLGPYTEFFFYYNKQNFANDGFFLDFTFASLISLGVHPLFIMPIDEKLQIESSLQMNIVSLSARMVEVEDLNDGSNEESVLKLVTPFSGMNTQWNIGIRYHPIKLLSIKLRYEAGISRTTHQKYMISVSDNAIFSVNIHF